MQGNILKEVISNQNIKEKSYWYEKLSGEIVRSSFPYSFTNEGADDQIGIKEFKIQGDTYSQIMKISNKSDFNLYLLLLSSVVGLLYRYTSNKDIIVGTPIFKKDVENSYLNTVLPLRNIISKGITFKELLVQVKNNALEAIDNQNYPIEVLVQQLGLSDREDEFPLFDVVIILENIQSQKFIEHIKANFTFSFINEDEYLRCRLEYNKKHYKDNMCDSVASHFMVILDAFLKNINAPIDSVDMLLSHERKAILNEFNDTKADYAEDQCFQELFENQVRRNPLGTAVVFQGESLTYSQLNEKSNQVANMLRRRGIKNNSIVAVSTDISIDLFVGVLGILKAGGAYLPIDFNLPEDRINYMLDDSKVKLLIGAKDIINKVKSEIEVIDLQNEELYKDESRKIDIVNVQHDLVYIIYTSGSTGVPKGVMVENKGLVNYTCWFIRKADLNNRDRAILTSSFAFDLGYTSVFPALAGGCELHIIKKELYSNPSELLSYLKKNKITYLKMTPSLFGTIINSPYYSGEGMGQDMKLVVLGGEQINIRDIEKLNKINPKIRVINHYGPTESTIGSIAEEIDFNYLESYKENTTIGMPIDNVRVHILDENLNPMPVEIPGEIYICGKGVARGYLNNEELTEKKFISNIFSKDKSEKMYSTGDLGMYLKNGHIVFLGRKDNQVKIRGYRVETGEIERRLIMHTNVKDAVVIAEEDNNGTKYLCAYITTNMEIEQTKLRNYLMNKLPEYMVPSYFVFLQNMPLTPNGKINRRLLPNHHDFSKTKVYDPPRNYFEQVMCNIWSEVLEIDNISINDNFFQIGGHSINVIRAVSALQQQSIYIKINDIYKYQTIKDIYDNILANGEKTCLINNIQSAQENVLTTLGLKNKITEYRVLDNKMYIMYVENFNFSVLEKLEQYIKDKFEVCIQPHYIVTLPEIRDVLSIEKILDSDKFIQTLRLKFFCSDEQKKVLQEIKNQEIAMEKILLSNPLVRRYPISPAQRVRLKNNEVTGSILRFDRYVNKDAMEKAIISLINSQSLLRSALVSENKQLFWEEHSKVEKIVIPYIDLSMYDFSFDRNLQENFIKDYFYNWNLADAHICYRALLIKLNNRETILSMPFMHIIYDRVSREIIESEITKNYNLFEGDINAEVKNQTIGYHEYVNQVGKGPVDLQPEEVEKIFELKEYSRYLHKLNKSIDVYERTQNTKVEYKLQSSSIDKAWELSLVMFTLFCRKFLNITKIPLLILHHGRKFQDKSYFETIGEFANYIPILLDGEEREVLKFREKIQSKIQIAEKHNVNFARLAEINDELGNYLKNLYSSTIVIFNFQGVYGMKGISELEKILFEGKKALGLEENVKVINFTARCTKDSISISIDLPFKHDEVRIQRFLDCEIARILGGNTCK